MVSNEALREMARVALEEWELNDYTDPDGSIKSGLKHLASPGDWGQESINGRVKHIEDWDGLEEWAKFLGANVAVKASIEEEEEKRRDRQE